MFSYFLRLASILGLFLIIQLSLAFFTFERNYPVTKGKSDAVSNDLTMTEEEENVRFAALLDKNLTVTTEAANYDLNMVNRCKSLIYQSWQKLPKDHANQLKSISFMFDENLRRGYGGQTGIRIRCANISDSELVAVFLHEMGHIVDTGLKTGSFMAGRSNFTDGNTPIYENDPSVKFYRISWLTNTKIKQERSLNFISGYAKTDPFEDFAESYNAYITQGPLFRAFSKENITLRRKYEVLKKYFFNGNEFSLELDQKLKFNPFVRNYDTTILAYNLSSFLVN